MQFFGEKEANTPDDETISSLVSSIKELDDDLDQPDAINPKNNITVNNKNSTGLNPEYFKASKYFGDIDKKNTVHKPLDDYI